MYQYRNLFETYLIKNKNMKNLTAEIKKDLFTEFALSIDEMICVRGGEEDPIPPRVLLPPINL